MSGRKCLLEVQYKNPFRLIISKIATRTKNAFHVKSEDSIFSTFDTFFMYTDHNIVKFYSKLEYANKF
jgi:hypothetical protein